jgi:hypothetical protein
MKSETISSYTRRIGTKTRNIRTCCRPIQRNCANGSREFPASNLFYAARGNRRFQATATGEWRVLDGTGSEATSRKLTTEEPNEFAAEHADMESEILKLGHEVQNLWVQLETIRQ